MGNARRRAAAAAWAKPSRRRTPRHCLFRLLTWEPGDDGRATARTLEGMAPTRDTAIGDCARVIDKQLCAYVGVCLVRPRTTRLGRTAAGYHGSTRYPVSAEGVW